MGWPGSRVRIMPCRRCTALKALRSRIHGMLPWWTEYELSVNPGGDSIIHTSMIHDQARVGTFAKKKKTHKMGDTTPDTAGLNA